MRDEEEAVEQREAADHDVGDRRARSSDCSSLLRDREDVTHWAVSPSAGAALGCLVDIVGVSDRKTSSRLDAHRPQLDAGPSRSSTTALRELAPDVAAALARPLRSRRRRRVDPASATRATPAIAAERAGRVGAIRRPPARTSSPSRAAAIRQVVGRVDGHDLALVDDDDALAGLRDFGQDVRAEDDRVIAGELLDQLARLDDLLRVEAGGRLVEDQHVGVVDQRLRQADALLVALRQLASTGGSPCRRRASAP